MISGGFVKTIDKVGGLADALKVIPSLFSASASLRATSDNTDTFSKKVETEQNITSLLSAVLTNGADLTASLKELTDSANNLTSALTVNTDKDGNFNILKMGDLNPGVNGIEKAEYMYSDAIKGVMAGVTSGTVQIDDITKGIHDKAISKENLAKAVKNVKGPVGAILAAALEVSGVNDGIDRVSESSSNLAAVVKTRLNEFDSDTAQQLSALVSELITLANVEKVLTNNIRELFSLYKIL